MRKRIVLFFLLVMLSVFPVSVQAKQPATTQEPPSVIWDGKLLLAYTSIWPEYEYSPEKPGQLNVLVINRYVIDPQNVQFPTKVRVQIPASAIAPHRVAVGQAPETASDEGVAFTTSAPDAKGWIDVFVTASAPAILVEYYDYNIARKGASREFIYVWPGTYAVNTFRVDVRVPRQATNMRSNPDADLAGTDAEGFKFGEMRSVSDMVAGKTFQLKINYDRDTDQPSKALAQVTPSPATQPVNAPSSPPSDFPWAVVVGFVVVVIVAAASWYWFSTRKGGRSARVGRKGKR